MTLANHWVLHFLWLLPLVAAALVVSSRQKRRSLEAFVDPHLLARHTDEDRRGGRLLKGLLLLASLGLMLFSLAGPRWGSHYQEISRKGVDIVVVVDVSGSMLVEDMEPNRLERARGKILDFLRVIQGDRVTLDYAALQMFVDGLQPDLVPVPGTDLGAAIEKGLSALDSNARTDKVIILVTDGEDNEGQGVEAARKAAAKGVKIFSLGMGEPWGGPIPVANGTSGFKQDKGGKLIISRLGEESLRRIAALTGGSYVRSVATNLDLEILYFDGIRSRTEAHILKGGKIKVYEERFSLFLLPAFILLLLEDVIR